MSGVAQGDPRLLCFFLTTVRLRYHFGFRYHSPKNTIVGGFAPSTPQQSKMEQAKRKTKRFIRNSDAVGFEFNPKLDPQIIKLVYDYRFANSEQIAVGLGRSNQVVLRRLQKLFHWGYLDRIDPREKRKDRSEKYAYALWQEGVTVLVNHCGIDRAKIRWERERNEVKNFFLRHTLMVSQFRACLTAALREHPEAKLIFWIREDPQELRDSVYFRDGFQKKKLPIVPDGYFGMEYPEGKMYFFLEADRSTTTDARFLNKMKAYWLWYKQGGQTRKFHINSFRVFTITETSQRMSNLLRMSQKADDRQTGAYMFWFTTEDSFNLENPQSILEPIWKTNVIGDEKLHSILE